MPVAANPVLDGDDGVMCAVCSFFPGGKREAGKKVPTGVARDEG